MSRPRSASWDPALVEQQDPLPTTSPVPTCRPCLGTGIVFTLADGFSDGCVRCGIRFVAVDE